MKPGDRVFVFPKAHGRKGPWGRVVEASRNDHSLTVVFEHKPHFSAADAFETVLIESSVNSFVLALSREQNATPFWMDFTGRRYGISMLAPDTTPRPSAAAASGASLSGRRSTPKGPGRPDNAF